LNRSILTLTMITLTLTLTLIVWEVRADSIDSGSGLGNSVRSILNLDFTLVRAGETVSRRLTLLNF